MGEMIGVKSNQEGMSTDDTLNQKFTFLLSVVSTGSQRV